MTNFNLIRPIYGGVLTQSQVDGINAIMAAHQKYGDKDNLNILAYELATAFWETGQAMQPVYERGSRTYFDKYEPGTKIGKMLGNTLKGDGYRFRGAGLVQLTGRRNFTFWARRLGVDLVAHPEMALQPDISSRILVEGMKIGAFTGLGLSKAIDGVDEGDIEDLREYKEARRTVNGVDKDDEIAALALRFEKALRSPGVNYPGGSAPPRRVPDTGVTPPLPVPDMKTNKIRTTSVLAAIFLPILYGIMKLFGWAP